MNAPAGLRLQLFTLRTYAAFRISEVVPGQWDRVSPLGEIDADTLEEALAKALAGDRPSTSGLFHKDRLVIREEQEDGEASLHLYVIRQKSVPRYVYDSLGRERREFDLYPEKVCVVPNEVLAIARAEAEGAE